MELRDYLRVLRRRWPIVVACVLVAVAVAAAITWRTTPQFRSTAKLFISTTASSSAETFQGASYSTQRVSSYADLVKGTELATRVIAATGVDLEPRALAAKVSAQATPETVLLAVSVTDADPALAQELTDAYATELSALVAELETPPGQSRPVLKATTIDMPDLPETPVTPQPARNLALGGVLGLLLGLGLAVGRDLLDTSVKSPDDLVDALDVGLLGSIAFDPHLPKRPLITDLGSHEPRFEAFRVLRTNLQFVDVDAACKTIVVTSSVPGEGKSTTAVNIALALGLADQRVLLVGADLRRPRAGALLGADTAVGLTSVLAGQLDVEDAIQSLPSGVDVLTSGPIPPNPAELLQSHAMETLLATVRSRYDVILIDAPPLLPVIDASIIASQVDGALVVVRHGKTKREQLRLARQRLEAVGAHPIASVLNMAPGRASSYYGYGYGYAPDAGRRKAVPVPS